jgi:predicted dehydrogenase
MKRRKFIEVTSMGSAALASSLYFPSLVDNRTIKIGLVGAGWYGMVDIRAALKIGGVEVIGICDIDSDHLKTSLDEVEKLQGKRPASFKYYKDLLDMKGLEALFIGTQPHWHALIFIAACEKGLDVYCEKPLSYDIQEGIAMVNASKKAGNIAQIGFQRRNSNAYQKAKELIEGGRIGKVNQINVQIHYHPTLLDNTIQAPPASLDWEEWCGPAPKLDYRPNIGHNAWRLEKEYGNGHLVDWGLHNIDIIRKTMSEEMPTSFYSLGGLTALKGKITTPDMLTANMSFKSAPVIWQHRLWGTGDTSKEFNNGIFFYGEKATMFASEGKLTIFNDDKEGKREDMPIPTEGTQELHVGKFLKAVRNKDKSLVFCTPEDAWKSTATVQLAMISYYTGSVVKWDQEKKEIIGNPEASKLMKREYRGKYVHP